MTARLFDLRLIALAFALALVMMGVTMYKGQIWSSPGTDGYYPTNDCGKNYSLKLEYTLPDGTECVHTRGIADQPYVRRVQKSFAGEENWFTSTLDLALQYIENVVWRIAP